MTLAVTKRGIAAFCGVATTILLCSLLAVFITVEEQKPGGSAQYAITTPTFSPTISYMPSISTEPSGRPSTTPTLSADPSHQPSVVPSSLPSMLPSSVPSSMPSSQPSLSPTTSKSPSSQPSQQPTGKPSENPTLSSSPSLAPSNSSMPTCSPSSEPSFFSSEYPSANPSFEPSTNPSLSPSNQPTSIPSAAQPEIATTTTIDIKTGKSDGNLLAVGAACFVLVASTTLYLRRRQHNSDLQCPTDQNDKYPQYGYDEGTPNSSDSVDSAGTGELSTTKEKHTKVDDVDLEDGRGGPNSVYNKLMARKINIMTVVDMAEAIHVPRLFTRQKEKVIDDKQSVSDSVEVTSKACKPVRVISRLSPMFSPKKESIKMKEQKRRSLAANNQKSRSMACLASPPMIHGSSCDSDSAASSSGTIPTSCIKNDDDVQAKKATRQYSQIMNNTQAQALPSHDSAESGAATSSSSPEPVDVPGDSLQFMYEEELLNSVKEGGGFSFRDVYFDPENELYECQVSGRLGISVYATQLGLRIQKINPTSPLCNIISAGDVIIGVDDVDVVGVETCVFWQLASRRANNNCGCCLVIMKI